MREEYDLAIGFLLIVLAFIIWGFDIYFGFITLNPLYLYGAIFSLIWFLFAPVYITRVVDFRQWTLSKWGNSIWSAIMWREYVKKHTGGDCTLFDK